MKKIIFSLALSLYSLCAFAQESAVYSQYQVFPILVNPGYTGFQDKHEFLVNARRSWLGFTGTPSSYTFMYSAPIGDKLALGGGVFAENMGDISTVKLQLNYAFRFKIQKAVIGMGLSTEFIRRGLNNSLLNDRLVEPGDQVLEDWASGQQIFDATLGIHTLYDNRFFASLALPNTVRARLDQLPGTDPGGNEGLLSYYIFQLGYILDVPKQNFKFIPSLAVRNMRDVPYQIDVNLQGRFLEEKLIAGLTFRPSTGGSMAFLLGSKYKQFQILYSYDVSFGPFQQYSIGSHELSVGYSLDRKKPKAGQQNKGDY